MTTSWRKKLVFVGALAGGLALGGCRARSQDAGTGGSGPPYLGNQLRQESVPGVRALYGGGHSGGGAQPLENQQLKHHRGGTGSLSAVSPGSRGYLGVYLSESDQQETSPLQSGVLEVDASLLANSGTSGTTGQNNTRLGKKAEFAAGQPLLLPSHHFYSPQLLRKDPLVGPAGSPWPGAENPVLPR